MKRLWLKDVLETKRCLMKIPEESEAEHMWNLISEDTTKYMIWDKWDNFSRTIKNIQETIYNAEAWRSWDAAIYNKGTDKCIGRCGINKIDDDIPSFELGYWISEEFYGKWIMSECINKYLEYAFEESNFEKWVIRCNSENENSKKVALKCWFKLEGEFKNHERIKWELRDTTFFWITRTEYLLKN